MVTRYAGSTGGAMKNRDMPSPSPGRPHLGSAVAAIAVVGVLTVGGALSIASTAGSGSVPAVVFEGRAATVHEGEAGGAGRCSDCHRFERELSHPVGVLPSMPIPEAFPLEGGLLTCNSCHEAPAGHAAGSSTGLVRHGRAGESLCVQCHVSGDRAEQGHAGVHGMPAHLAGKDRSASDPGPFDSESRSCLGCHDGIAASESDRRPGFDSAHDGMGSHPIGARLLPHGRSRRGDGARYVDPARLDSRIRLFDGGLGCGSCHSVYSGRDQLLVVSNFKSGLCLSCHDE